MARLFLDFFGGVERVAHWRVGALRRRLNALANESAFAAGYLRLRRLLQSSRRGETTHRWLRLARDTRVTTAVEAAVPAAKGLDSAGDPPS